MNRRIALLLVIAVLCSVLPAPSAYSESNNNIKGLLLNLNPQKILEKSNEDMRSLYGAPYLFSKKTSKGYYNEALVQKRIKEGLIDPEKFSGFEFVYGSSHDDPITYKGVRMYRYSGYSIEGDDVSTKEYPWDAGWGGKQLQNLNMIKHPWNKVKGVNKGKFDLYGVETPASAKFKELVPEGTFERLIIEGLNREYTYSTNKEGEIPKGKFYKEFMYNNKDSQFKDHRVYTYNATPRNGRWIDYVHVIQPPTYLSQGLGRVYMKGGTYKDIPIAAISTLPGQDISVQKDSVPINAIEGSQVNVSVVVRSNYTKKIKPTFSWVITSGGRPLTAQTDHLKFSGGAKTQSGAIEVDKNNRRVLYASFKMPSSSVKVQFKVNPKGLNPKEDLLSNNEFDSTIKLVVPEKLPYDVLSMRIRYPLPTNTAKLNLPSLPGAAWTGNATGALNVLNEAPNLYRNYVVTNNNPVNEPSETITRSPIPKYTIKREDYEDDPLHRKWRNLEDPSKPLQQSGVISYRGEVSRPYRYTERVCTPDGKGGEHCVDVERHDIAKANFNSNSVKETYDMYVYNGRKEIPKWEYRDTIEKNSETSKTRNLFWTNEPYEYSVIRWMHHLDEYKKPFAFTVVPGQYKRKFIQQASGALTWGTRNSMATDYAPSRQAAKERAHVKTQYDKAVFATDTELQKFKYPVKSGYYFNPTGEYTLNITTTVYKPKDGPTKDHEDLVNALIHSFRYQSDLIYINAKKEAVNLRNVKLQAQGGGFKRQAGVLSVQNNKGVNAAVLLEVEKDPTLKSVEIKHSQRANGETHEYWKRVLEGYSESKTLTSKSAYQYREYVADRDDAGKGQHIYKITETTKVTFKINPNNVKLYTHANMQNGNYTIRAWIDKTALSKYAHAYKVLKSIKGVTNLDSIPVTVVGSIFDDLNN